MILTQLVDIASPLAYWTGENFATGNVYDEYANWTLVNNGATLGEDGGNNPSISSRSINLNGGYLQLLDGTFTNSNLIDRNLSIQFGFRIPNRTKDNPIAGYKPIISKWSPDQQWAIVMENGIISVKIQTGGGVVGLDFDYPDIIYNDRWNFVQLQIFPTIITLHVNGCKVSLSDSSLIATSNNSIMTIGGQNTELHNQDFLISDISLTRAFNDNFAKSMYALPRTVQERTLDFNPTHYFDLLAAPSVDSEHINRGSAGGYGYIVSTGADPTVVDIGTNVVEKTIQFPVGSKFVVDTIPDINFSTGFSMITRGQVIAGANDLNVGLRIFEGRNSLANNNGRFYLTYINYSAARYFKYQGYDASGVLIATYAPDDSSALQHFQYGTKVFSFGGIDADYSTTKIYDSTHSNSNIPVNYTPPLPYNYLDIWSNVGYQTCYASQISLFDYTLPVDVSEVIDPVKFKMVSDLFRLNKSLIWILYGNTNFETSGYITGSIYIAHPLSQTVGYSYANNIYDPLDNRQNDFVQSIYLPSTTSYVGGQDNENDMHFSAGMTIYGFFWNRNTQTRYRMIYNTDGTDFEVWMNSRDGAFSYGDVELRYDKDIADTFISTTDRSFVDNGFHFLAIVRDGNLIQIWIDGVVAASKVMITVPTLSSSSTCMRLHGGPLYVNEWGMFGTASDSAQIALIYGGFQDYIKGQCTLSGVPLACTLLATDANTGRVMKTYPTDNDGFFKAFLPKSLDGETITVLALANDDNATNNVVAHGPYNLQTTYRKYAYETTVEDYDDMVIDMEPYAYYKMDESSGVTIVDSSGNGRDGTAIGGITLNQDGPASFMRSINFDGINGYVDLPDGYDVMSGGFTFEFWARYSTIAPFTPAFTIQSDSYTNVITISTNNTNPDITLFVSGASGYVTANTISVLTWTHYVIRIAPDGSQSLWVNGTKASENLGDPLPVDATRTRNYWGRIEYSGSGSGWFTGNMSNASTYDYALPDEEIAKHAARGFEAPVQTLKSLILQSNPAMYFTFDRLDEYDNQTDNAIVLTSVGTHVITKNALGINTGVVGNNYLTTDDFALGNNGDGWTIEFSFKSDGTQVEAILLAEWDTGGTDTGTYKIQLNNSNLISVHINNAATQMQSTTTYNDDEWHHVVVVNDGLDNLTLYVDGASEDTLGTSMTYGLMDFSIGNSADGDASTATEQPTYLDDVAIYEYALNASHIVEHYNQFIKKKVYQ